MDTRPFVCKLRLHLTRLPDCVCSILLIFEEIRSRFALTRPLIYDASFNSNLVVKKMIRLPCLFQKIQYSAEHVVTSGRPSQRDDRLSEVHPIMSDHKSIPVAGRWFSALGIRYKSRDSSYLSCFIKARVSCSNAILSGWIGVSLNANGRARSVLLRKRSRTCISSY